MSKVAIGIKYHDDNEFECMRRILSKLGLSAPESDDHVLCLCQYRRIERAINSNFIDLNKVNTLTEENKRLREALRKLAYASENNTGAHPSLDLYHYALENAKGLLSELGGE